MFDDKSRYAKSATREHVGANGRRRVYVRPRVTPPPEHYLIATRQVVSDSDRLDTLAYRTQGEPTAFWLLADANRTMHPSALTAEPGTLVALPVPGATRIKG